MIDVCVVGAGVAGLTAARYLQSQGQQVLVLEKSRGLGGRAATRTLHGQRVDHGAQHFTVRDQRFQQLVGEWLRAGYVAEWTKGFHSLSVSGVLQEPDGKHPRYIFPDGMNKMGKLLAEGLEVKRETRVTAVQSVSGNWKLTLYDGSFLEAKQVIINMPAPQALEIIDKNVLDKATLSALSQVKFNPCFAVMAGYENLHAPAWSGVTFDEDSTLSWLSHDSSKRLESQQTVLVLHSSPSFARRHYESERRSVESKMLKAASVLSEWINNPIWTDSQRWRYALAKKHLSTNHINVANNLFFCGDWCGGARIEAAFLSGYSVAKAVMLKRV